MAESPFTLHRRAKQALLGLSETERSDILKAIEDLGALPSSEWPASTVKRLDAPEPLNLLRATPEFRVIFRMNGAGGEILDVVSRETLRAFASSHPE